MDDRLSAESERLRRFLVQGARFVGAAQPPIKFGEKKGNLLKAIFKQKLDLRERCKGVHFVDLGESFPATYSASF